MTPEPLTRRAILRLEADALNAAVMEALGYVWEADPRGVSVSGWRYQHDSGGAGLRDAHGNRYVLMVNPRVFPNFAVDLKAAFALPLEGVEFHLRGGSGIEPRAQLIEYQTGRCVALADAKEPATACARAWLLWRAGV